MNAQMKQAQQAFDNRTPPDILDPVDSILEEPGFLGQWLRDTGDAEELIWSAVYSPDLDQFPNASRTACKALRDSMRRLASDIQIGPTGRGYLYLGD